MDTQYAGFCCVSVTPFDKQGNVDEGALRAHLQRIGAAGLNVYPASGGTGEGYLLSDAEVDRIYEISVEELRGKTLVYAGMEPANTEHVIQRAKQAAAIGVDVVTLAPPRPGPPGLRPSATVQELERYYQDTLEAITTPVILSVNMFVIPVEVPVEMIQRLLQSYPQIVGVAVSMAPSPTYMMRLIDAVADKVAVTSATGDLMTTLCLGGHGAFSLEPNVAPRLCRSIVDSYRQGDYAASLKAYTLLLHLSPVLLKYQNPRTIKAAMRAIGLPAGGEMRRPYLALGEAVEAELRDELKSLNISEIDEL